MRGGVFAAPRLRGGAGGSSGGTAACGGLRVLFCVALCVCLFSYATLFLVTGEKGAGSSTGVAAPLIDTDAPRGGGGFGHQLLSKEDGVKSQQPPVTADSGAPPLRAKEGGSRRRLFALSPTAAEGIVIAVLARALLPEAFVEQHAPFEVDSFLRRAELPFGSPSTRARDASRASADYIDSKIRLSRREGGAGGFLPLSTPAAGPAPARDAWRRHRALDWHDLVPLIEGEVAASAAKEKERQPSSSAAAAAVATLARSRREAAKSLLIDHLQGFAAAQPVARHVAAFAAAREALSGDAAAWRQRQRVADSLRGTAWPRRSVATASPSKNWAETWLRTVLRACKAGGGDVAAALPPSAHTDEELCIHSFAVAFLVDVVRKDMDGATATTTVNGPAFAAAAAAAAEEYDDNVGEETAGGASLSTGGDAQESRYIEPRNDEGGSDAASGASLPLSSSAFSADPPPWMASATDVLLRGPRVQVDDLAAFRSPGTNHGPLSKFASCGLLADPCLIHASLRECVEDELCGWCAPAEDGAAADAVCMDRTAPFFREKATGGRNPTCADPRGLLVTLESVPVRNDTFFEGGGDDVRARLSSRPAFRLLRRGEGGSTGGGGGGGSAFLPTASSTCGLVVTRRRPLLLGLHGNSKMAFHFLTETAPQWFSSASAGGALGAGGLRQHTWIEPNSVADFWAFALPFSDSCPRRLDAGHRSAGYGLPPRPSPPPAAEAAAKDGAPLSPPDHRAADDARGGWGICYLSKSGPKIKTRTPLVASASASGGHSPPSRSPASANVRYTGLEAPLLAFWNPLRNSVAPLSPSDSEAAFGSLSGAIRAGMRVGLSGATEALSIVSTLATEAGSLLQERKRKEGSSLPAGAEVDDNDAAAVSSFWSSLCDAAKRLSTAYASASSSSLPSFLLHALFLARVAPAPSNPLVTLISRRNKRFIINEADVVDALLTLPSSTTAPSSSSATSTGAAAAAAANGDISQRRSRRLLGDVASVSIAALESMPLYEQLLLLRRSRVLVGVHGSGLSNSIFMAPGGALLQVVPHRLEGASAFFAGAAAGARVSYNELAVSARERARFHWHFLDASYADRRDKVLRDGSGCCGQAVYFAFYINQDLLVDAGGLAERVRELLKITLPKITKTKALAEKGGGGRVGRLEEPWWECCSRP